MNQTKRPIAPGAEKFLDADPISVLDHGFIRVVDYMGNDTSIVQAARVSYQGGTQSVSDNKSLINYLMSHRHTTPFEMCEIKLHLKMPIFVARQWIRHRTASINEMSARYSILSKEFYLPNIDDLAPQSTTNKQGKAEKVLSLAEAENVLEILKKDAEQVYDHYRFMLNENDEGKPINPMLVGIARELARMDLTLNYYTEFYWKIDLHNLFHFLGLRVDKHAQFEIREYADRIQHIVSEWVPFAFGAFKEYRRDSVTLSATAINIIKGILEQDDVSLHDLAKPETMSKREYNEFLTNFFPNAPKVLI